jgi:hypothetical protein
MSHSKFILFAKCFEDSLYLHCLYHKTQQVRENSHVPKHASPHYEKIPKFTQRQACRCRHQITCRTLIDLSRLDFCPVRMVGQTGVKVFSCHWSKRRLPLSEYWHSVAQSLTVQTTHVSVETDGSMLCNTPICWTEVFAIATKMFHVSRITLWRSITNWPAAIHIQATGRDFELGLILEMFCDVIMRHLDTLTVSNVVC